MTDLISLARNIAVKAHEGSVRRGGGPYVTHLERVAAQFTGEFDQCVAWLHDVLEKTPFGLEQLEHAMPNTICASVLLLTHRKSVEYQAYIRQLTIDDRARRVKIADIMDNLSDSPTDRQREKYSVALKALEAA